MPSVPRYVVCDRCGRTGVPESSDFTDWLVGYIVRRHRRTHRTTIVRCPQHLTRWALWVSGRRENKTMLRWMKEAKARDLERHPHGFANPILEPYYTPDDASDKDWLKLL